MRLFVDVEGFEWDAGNSEKNLIKHSVSNSECEEAFSDERKLIRDDPKHSNTETRHQIVGRTNLGRILFISFTIRRDKIRVISARDVNKKERTYYEKQEQ